MALYSIVAVPRCESMISPHHRPRVGATNF